MAKNSNLHNAKKEKNDEFYTQLSDIENELKYYKNHFKDKTVFCNCDDPEHSNFWKYFVLNFNHLGLNKLISTHFEKEKPSYKLEFDGVYTIKTNLKENGDFRSPECIEILKETDIVVTNPPFSLFREYVAQLMVYQKKILIIGNINAVSYKEIFPLIKDNKLWIGYKFNGSPMLFRVPKNYEATGSVIKEDSEGNTLIGVGGTCWFTNLDIPKRHEKMILTKEYNEKEYPKYDNYDAINVDKTLDIPKDYKGVMGVPISFMDKYNPEQFQIVGAMTTTKVEGDNYGYPYINKKKKYARILVKRKDL